MRKKFIGNAAIYLGANVINAGIPFLLLPILTRVLTPADYGIVAMFSIVLNIFGAFTGLSVHGAIGVRYFQMKKDELAEYIGTTVGILVISTGTLLLLIFILGPWLAKISGVPTDWLLAAGILSGFQFLGNIRLTLWQVSEHAKKYGTYQVTQSLLNAGSSLIFILIVGLAWQGRVLGQMASIMAFGVLSLILLTKDKYLVKPKNFKMHGRDALNFGLPLIPHVIGGLAIVTAGQFLTTNTLGIAETGVYVIGVQFGSILSIIADAFVKAYGPWLYKHLDDKSINYKFSIVGLTYYIFIAFFLLSTIFSIIIYMLFPMLIGEKFIAARSIVIFFIFGSGFVGMYYAVVGLFFFTSKTKYVSIATVSSGAFSIFLMWILGENFGVKGISIGYLLSQILRFTFTFILSFRVYPLPWMEFKKAFSSVYLLK